jgi:hypothetical protein
MRATRNGDRERSGWSAARRIVRKELLGPWLTQSPFFAILRTVATTASVVERLRARIGVEAPPTKATVEAGHLKRFAEAIGDPNPRWEKEAPPTFLVGLAAGSVHLAEAEEYGKGWLNGGNRFEYFVPLKVRDRITATGRVADVYEKAGGSGNLLFIIFETDYVNQDGELVARLRSTAIRR